MQAVTTRVGLVGAGYIASWHADALSRTADVRVTAVCDLSPSAAEALAARCGAQNFTSIDALIDADVCDAVHILTTPSTHRTLAEQCLAAGLHVLVEKPLALSAADCAAIEAAARVANRQVAVCHNFLGGPAYRRLKAAISDGALGRIDCVDVHWRFPLAPLRSGPFGLWMLREPSNLMMELGPHAFAFLVDLLGPLAVTGVDVGKPVTVPGCGERHQSWRVFGRAGAVDFSVCMSLVEGIDDRLLSVRGVCGQARLEFAEDRLFVRRSNASDIVIGPLQEQLSAAWQHLREGVVNAFRQVRSLNAASPYALGFQHVMTEFHKAVRAGRPIDECFGPSSARHVMAAIEDTIRLAPPRWTAAPAMPVPSDTPRPAPPSVLVIGGTGFIGRVLTRALVASGRTVRVASRGRHNPFTDLDDRVALVAASLDDPAALRSAMDGIDVVFHLAKAEEVTWEAYLENDVGASVRAAEAALAAGVRRFVYAGTIASYDASRPDRPIDEETGFAEDMSDRNLYARSKALCETRLKALHAELGLPLVIARPGIVVGAGGPLQHWGLGRWNGPGAVRLWGDGRQTAPFVLVDDVADALMRMADAKDIEGASFNLVGDPLLTVRDYFDEIHRTLGSRIYVKSGSLFMLYVAGEIKYILKKNVLRKHGVMRASLRDWRSRAHLSPFRNERAKVALDWRPVADRETFVRRAITEADLFGF